MSSDFEAASSLPLHRVRQIVRKALEEDVPWGDITTDALIQFDAQGIGRFLIKEDGIVSGLGVAAEVFRELDESLRFEAFVSDGDRCNAGQTIAEVRGRARPILSGERTALNLLQRMSGIATASSRYVEAVRGTKATIVDTRKTVPGLRLLDKYAVRCGGGRNHRFSLSDAVLVKDNHLQGIKASSAGAVTQKLEELRGVVPHTVKVEVEVENLDELESALKTDPDIILLDNMPLELMQEAVRRVNGSCLIEASGGITLTNVRDVALTGVDLISVGALTHSVSAIDISLEMRFRSIASLKDFSEPQRVGDV